MNHEQMQMEFVRKLPSHRKLRNNSRFLKKSPSIKPNATKPFAVFLQANPTSFS